METLHTPRPACAPEYDIISATLTLIRGLPGSGKSTIAKTFGVPVFEADDYFTSPDGTYTFEPTQLRQAHLHCGQQVFKHLSMGVDCVVANTFSMQWEAQPYIDYCKKHGHTLKVIEATGVYQNVHGVPDDVIAKMRQRWAPSLIL
jgi:predicted ABC-type ATPase